jgi:hypothetical protein
MHPDSVEMLSALSAEGVEFILSGITGVTSRECFSQG